MSEYINLDEFWNLIDGKQIDASTVFQTIEKCEKYSDKYFCLNCNAVVEKLICPECKVGILKRLSR